MQDKELYKQIIWFSYMSEAREFRSFKGKWQQTFLSAYLKETPKQYIEVYHRIFISALFGEIF